MPYALSRQRVVAQFKTEKTSVALTSMSRRLITKIGDLDDDDVMALREWIRLHVGVDVLSVIESTGPAGQAVRHKLKTATLTISTEADPEQVYSIDLGSRSAMEDRRLKLQMSLLGLLSETSSSAKNRLPELAAKTIVAAGKIAAGAIGVSAARTTEEKELAEAFADILDALNDPHLEAELRALAMRRGVLEAKRLEVLARPGNVPVETMKAVLARLDAETALISSAFLDKEVVEFDVRAPAILPVQAARACASYANDEVPVGDLASVTLFKFSTSDGVHPVRELVIEMPQGAGVTPKPVKALTKEEKDAEEKKAAEAAKQCKDYVALRRRLGRTEAKCEDCDVKPPTPIDLVLQRSPQSPQFGDVVRRSATAQPADGHLSFRYRVPVFLTCSLVRGFAAASVRRDVLARETLPFGQLGAVGALPAWVGGDLEKYDVKFHTDLAALASIDIDSRAPDTGAVIEALGSSASQVLGAEAARITAEEARKKAPPTEAELVEAEVRLLKAQIERKRLLEELELLEEGE